MIPFGSQRAGGQDLATHLLNAQDNERLEVAQVRGSVARDLHGAFAEWEAQAHMRKHWTPDASFFGKRTREQLVGIAVDCGYADAPFRLGSYKKADLVTALTRHFQSAKAAAEPIPAQQKAREWLPEAMLFPAVDIGAPAEAEFDEGEDNEE